MRRIKTQNRQMKEPPNTLGTFPAPCQQRYRYPQVAVRRDFRTMQAQRPVKVVSCSDSLHYSCIRITAAILRQCALTDRKQEWPCARSIEFEPYSPISLCYLAHALLSLLHPLSSILSSCSIHSLSFCWLHRSLPARYQAGDSSKTQTPISSTAKALRGSP